ncbi:MAG: hypothetical protein KBC64_00850 [Simkaniaceae bacterium]|nr:hypothetical protein [Simkaniaceae bacterium]
MIPVKKWYLEMRLAGHSHEEILKLSEDRYEGELRGNLSAYLERMGARAAGFQEAAAVLAGRVIEVGEGKEEREALEAAAVDVRTVAMATFDLLEASQKVKAEHAQELALRAKLRAQIEQLQKQPKRPIFSAIAGREARTWEKTGPGGSW